MQGVIDHFSNVITLSGGRTNKVWCFQEGDQKRVLKLFDEAGSAPMFPNDPEAESLVLKELAGTDLAPEFKATGTSDMGQWLLYAYLPGRSWNKDAGLVGTGLRRLHRLPAMSGLRSAPNGSAAVIAQTLSILSECTGTAARDLIRTQPSVPTIPETQNRLIHGDPVPSNILVRDDKVAFIDWQCPAVGDPCDDLAIFLSPAMQHVYRGAQLDMSERDAFFGGYADELICDRYLMLAPLFHWRMAAYCLWRAERGAAEYADGFDLEWAALADTL